MTEGQLKDQDDGSTQWASCPRCGGDRKCDVLGAHDHDWSVESEFNNVHGRAEHRILRCRGCEEIFFWRKLVDSETMDHVYDESVGDFVETWIPTIETFPTQPPRTDRPDWAWTLQSIDPVLSRIMFEIYAAAAVGCLTLASVGLRTAIDRVAEGLDIDPAMTMEEKVDALRAGGWVGDTEAKTLRVVADAGNAAAHRGWTPEAEEFNRLRATVEQFIQRAIVSGRGPLDFATKIPAKQKRRSKAVVIDQSKLEAPTAPRSVFDKGPS